jgi:hypothetical protein
MFQKYPHLERLGADDVEGILEGKVYVDGTLGTGSRRRVVTPGDDNQGFAAYIAEHAALYREVFKWYPDWRLYGEWLVPHSLKTYRNDAWRRFYVFDVQGMITQEFFQYEDYEQRLRDMGLDFIPIQAVVTNPTQEWLIKQLEANTYLIRDGEGVGEGIVLKRYDFVNKYGRTTWAKIVRNEFREKHKEEMGVSPVVMYNQEYEMSLMLTEHVIQKVIAELQPWSSRNIPQLLGRVWHEFVTEEMWAILKKYKNPTINFKALHRFVIQRTKELSGVF